MTMISLLGLPLDLPPSAPARAHGLTTFVSGLPEYLSRCQSSLAQTLYWIDVGDQAKPSKEVYPERHRQKHMGRTPSAH